MAAKERYTDFIPVRAFELARSGLSDTQVAQNLGVSPSAFSHWKKSKPALQEALRRGRQTQDGKQDRQFAEYVYNRLPQHLQDLWDQIHLCDQVDNGVSRAEMLLNRVGKEARQHLFLYALVRSHFNPSEACRAVHISRKQLNSWINEDPSFAELIDEIHWHKGNFYESALIRAVDAGEVACINFANSTYNRDRGYGTKVAVEHKGQFGHAHIHTEVKQEDVPTLADVADNLPLEMQEQLVSILRGRKYLPNVLKEVPTSQVVINGSRQEGGIGSPECGSNGSVPGGCPTSQDGLSDQVPPEAGGITLGEGRNFD